MGGDPRSESILSQLYARWSDKRSQYGEKLVILAQASEQVLRVLPSLPPSITRKYEGAQETAAIRAAVQKALDNWKPGQVDFPVQHPTVDLSRSDTKSFGETHASELSNIGHDDHPAPRPSTPQHPSGTSLHDPQISMPVPAPAKTEATSSKQATSPSVLSPPLHAGSLNLAPVELPAPTATPPTTTTFSHISGSDPIDSDSPLKFPQVTPTVAETGVPKSAGPDGPGPASGSLLEVKAAHDAHGDTPGHTTGTTSTPYLSAEEEKKRLEREERERILKQGPSTPTPKFESAEEEKKRLEREERERLLASDSGTNPDSGSGKPDESGDVPPPYKEF